MHEYGGGTHKDGWPFSVSGGEEKTTRTKVRRRRRRRSLWKPRVKKNKKKLFEHHVVKTYHESRELFTLFSTNIPCCRWANVLLKIETISISFGRAAKCERGPKTRSEEKWWANDFHRIRSRLCDTFIYFQLHCAHTTQHIHTHDVTNTAIHMDFISIRFVFFPSLLCNVCLNYYVWCGLRRNSFGLFFNSSQQSAVSNMCDFFMCVSVSFSRYLVSFRSFFFYFL